MCSQHFNAIKRIGHNLSNSEEREKIAGRLIIVEPVTKRKKKENVLRLLIL